MAELESLFHLQIIDNIDFTFQIQVTTQKGVAPPTYQFMQLPRRIRIFGTL